MTARESFCLLHRLNFGCQRNTTCQSIVICCCHFSSFAVVVVVVVVVAVVVVVVCVCMCVRECMYA